MIVRTDIPMTAKLCDETILALLERYPFLRSELLTNTAFDRPVRTLVIGTGPRKVLFTAAHHANEWITAPLLLKFMEQLAQAVEDGTSLAGTDARQLTEQVSIHTVPMVDPDGVDLVTGGIPPEDPQYLLAEQIAERFPQIPFPEGWNKMGMIEDLDPADGKENYYINFLKYHTRFRLFFH